MYKHDIDDAARVDALCRLGILDTPQEERFDRLTRLASAALQVPIVLVSLIDERRQWFKSRVGVDVPETPRAIAFCSHTIEHDEQMVVTDARLDPRFHDNPLVTGAPFIRFYAGQPIRAPDGHAIGTLCAIDHVAREITDGQRILLRDLAMLVQDEIHKDVTERARALAEHQLQQLQRDLELRVAERTRSLRDANEALRHEIGQRQELERTLRASERRIRTIIESSFSAFISIDAAGRIIDWNASAERTFGWSHAEAQGRDLSDTIVPERFRAAHRAGLARMLATGVATVLDQRLKLPAVTRSGTEITVEMTISSFAANDAVCFGAFLYDVTEREQAREALAQKQAMLDAILDSVDVGVVACDAGGAITLFNRAARELHGLPAEAIDPDHWAQHYDLFDAGGVTRLEQTEIPLFRAWQGETVKNAAMTVAPHRRSPRKLLASGRPLTGPAGEPLGAVVALSDITDLAASRTRLEQQRQHMHAITEALPAMIGHVDRNGCFTFVNSQAARFFGRTPEQMIGTSVQTVYSPGEYARMAPYLAAAMQGQRTGFEGEVLFGGVQRHYHANYIPDIDENGQVQGLFAMAHDITARKHSELRQRDSEERLRLITDNLPALITYIDQDRRLRFANAVHQDWLGMDPAWMLDKTLTEVLGEETGLQAEAALSACLRGRVIEGDILLKAGKAPRMVHSLFVPHRRGEEVLGVCVLTTDVTAAREHAQQLETLAMSDALTGLANRRSHDAQLANAILRAIRSDAGMALMFLDLDHFKAVNDTLGHALGDEVLKEFARRLLGVVRKTDLVCRLAGDEFTIILENVSGAEECAGIGAKIVAAMQVPFALAGGARAVTASIGVAWSPAARADAELLSRCADAALYNAKAAGRNRYAVATVA